jgi:sarcosine oxidase
LGAPVYDVIVAGLGVMGSAALANLARRGARVAGFDRFGRGHWFGASNGRSRLIRKAYYEDPNYVPLVLRAYDAWRELEALTGSTVLHQTGLLLAGRADSEIVDNAAKSATVHGLSFEKLDANAIRARFPAFAPLDDEIGLYEPDGGYLVPEVAVDAYLDLAAKNGASIYFHSSVAAWRRTGNGVRVTLGEPPMDSMEARRLILCAGAWMTRLGGDEVMPLAVQRNVQLWFRPSSRAFGLDQCPPFLLDRQGLPEPLYGVPDYGFGVKAAFHGYGVAAASVESLDRFIGASDVDPLTDALEAWMPGAAGSIVESRVCMYDLSPDRHFIVGAHPDEPRVILAGGFSGHGFKFASVMGEILADLALEGATPYDLEFLSPQRFRLNNR